MRAPTNPRKRGRTVDADGNVFNPPVMLKARKPRRVNARADKEMNREMRRAGILPSM